MFGRLEVEKVERFYLSSCTDLAATSCSTNQCFPLVDDTGSEDAVDNNNNNERSSSRSRSRLKLSASAAITPRRRRSRCVYNSKHPHNHARVTLQKICDSVMQMGSEHNDNSEEEKSSALSHSQGNITLNPSMSKAEFLKKLDCLVNGTSIPNSIRPRSSSRPRVSGRLSTSASIASAAAGPVALHSESGNSSNYIKSSDPSDSSSGPSTATKILVFGFFIAFLFGIVKTVTRK